MRRVGVVTGSRAEYGSVLPILRKIQASPDLKLSLLVTGMHLAPEFGLTVRVIEADGFEISERIDMRLSSDTPEAIATSMGLGTSGFARAYARLRPDILVVFGDRFEMLSAALAALPFKIPVAHIHGGELTQGAIDDALRHAITKLSHLHFVAMDEAARRVMQMGEEPWRVVVSGAPGLDALCAVTPLGPEELSAQYGLPPQEAPLLVTYHPVTLEYEQTEWHVRELLGALQACGVPVVFTAPNADTGGRIIMRLMQEFVEHHPAAWFVANLGTAGYAALMQRSAAMVGNSSSGIIEAPSFKLPVVNIGTRQQGRIRAENVIDVGYRREDILDGIQRAVAPAFRARLRGLSNPYGNGHAADVIVQRLREVSLDHGLLAKQFMDAPAFSIQAPCAEGR